HADTRDNLPRSAPRTRLLQHARRRGAARAVAAWVAQRRRLRALAGGPQAQPAGRAGDRLRPRSGPRAGRTHRPTAQRHRAAGLRFMNGILLTEKPEGLTSADVVRRVKRRIGGKIGHLGTLDPFATGLLPLCCGEATKIAQFLNTADKAYEGV